MEKPQLLLVLPASSELHWRTSNGFWFFYQSVFQSMSKIRSSSGLSPALTALCLPDHPSQQRHGAGDVINAYSAEEGSSPPLPILGPLRSIQWPTGKFTQRHSAACFLAVGTQGFQESHRLVWEAPSCCLAGEVLAPHIHAASGLEELSQSTFLACFFLKNVQKYKFKLRSLSH